METYTKLKELVENPRYRIQKQKSLEGFTDNMIDTPIIEIVNGFNKLPCCFTLQSCYGHFVYDGQTDIHNVEPLPYIPHPNNKIKYLITNIENTNIKKISDENENTSKTVERLMVKKKNHPLKKIFGQLLRVVFLKSATQKFSQNV